MLKIYLELRWYKGTNPSHLPLAGGSEWFELASFCCELSSKPQRQLDSSHLALQPPPNLIQREKWLILFSCYTELVPSIKKAWGTGKMNNLGQFSSASPLHNSAKKNHHPTKQPTQVRRQWEEALIRRKPRPIKCTEKRNRSRSVRFCQNSQDGKRLD